MDSSNLTDRPEDTVSKLIAWPTNCWWDRSRQGWTLTTLVTTAICFVRAGIRVGIDDAATRPI